MTVTRHRALQFVDFSIEQVELCGEIHVAHTALAQYIPEQEFLDFMNDQGYLTRYSHTECSYVVYDPEWISPDVMVK